MKPKNYYSQNGEDIVLWSLFKDQTEPGFFIEVGALDGLRFSNTYSFEEAGWVGMCIEAHPDYIELLQRNRPNSIVVHAAVGEENRDAVEFYANARGSLSTLDPSLENEFRKYGHYFSGWEARKVPMRTLNSILEEYHIEPPIDIFSIDIEGTELFALRGFDLERYSPRVFVIEALNEGIERELDAFFEERGYLRARRIASNIFYCRDKDDAYILKNASNQGYLMHSLHPLDYLGGKDLNRFKVVAQDLLQQARPIAEIVSQTPLAYSHLADEKTIEQFTSEPENTYLVSFPRTGSHWLRMLLELYFDRPTLSRIFYQHPNENYLLMHHHDLECELIRSRVIYLYRDPVDTIFSQMNYHQEKEDDPQRVAYWSHLYAQHLNKWLIQERFVKQKLVLCYENLQHDAIAVLRKICLFMNEQFDEARAKEACEVITKEHVKKRIEIHDSQVVNPAHDYEQRRRKFRENFSQFVWDTIRAVNPAIVKVFEGKYIPGGRMTFRQIMKKKNGNQAKIVGLVAARNEQEQLGFCLRALSLYTDAIVYLDDCSEDDSVEIVEKLARECNVERIIRKTRWVRDEPGDRNELLRVGREIGGTHFILMDADEAFTSCCLEDDLLRQLILSLHPGDRLALKLIHLWRSTRFYRCDESIWSPQFREHIFCDDGISSYDSDFIHTPRVPQTLSGKTIQLEGDQFGILHFQFVNWRNLLIKQAWYRCLERIRHPERSIEAINARYAPSKDETRLGLKPAPEDWFARYPFFDPSIFAKPDEWRVKQIAHWIDEYGVEYFAGLDIWDIDWRVNGRSVLPQSASFYLRKARETTTIQFQGGCYSDEGGWRWLDEHASILIPKRAIDTSSGLSLKLTCGKAEFYDRFPFDVRICLNGEQIGNYSFKESEQTLPIEVRFQSADQDQRVVIQSDSSFVPAEKGHSDDRRRLAIRLMDLQIVKLGEPMPGQTMNRKIETASIAPDLVELLQRADAFIGQGDYESALEPLEKALSLNSESPELINAYGNVLLRLNRFEEARRQFVKATVLAPKYAPGYAGLVVALLLQNKLSAAEEALQGLLQIAPNSEEGKILLDEIRKRKTGVSDKVEITNDFKGYDAEKELSELFLLSGDQEEVLSFYRDKMLENSDERAITSILGEFFTKMAHSDLFWKDSNEVPCSNHFDIQEVRNFLEKFNWGEETEEYHLAHLNRYLITLDFVAGLPKTTRVLEIGAAPFGMTQIMKEYLFENIVPTGFAEKNVLRSDKIYVETVRFYDHLGNLLNSFEVPHFNAEKHTWPFEDGTFELVMACEIFEHLAMDPMHVVAEANRVLCPGGHFLITVPNVLSLSNIQRILDGKQPNIFPYYRPSGVYGRHNRELSTEEIAVLLEAGGFDVLFNKTFNIYSSNNKPPKWLEWLVGLMGENNGRRGEIVIALARKNGPIKERYPLKHELYYCWDFAQ